MELNWISYKTETFLLFLHEPDFIYLFVCLFSPALHSMWDLSSPTRDQTHTPCSASTVLATGPPVDSHKPDFKNNLINK